eukprot:553506-Rhodomonas_salina.1
MVGSELVWFLVGFGVFPSGLAVSEQFQKSVSVGFGGIEGRPEHAHAHTELSAPGHVRHLPPKMPKMPNTRAFASVSVTAHTADTADTARGLNRKSSEYGVGRK